MLLSNLNRKIEKSPMCCAKHNKLEDHQGNNSVVVKQCIGMLTPWNGL